MTRLFSFLATITLLAAAPAARAASCPAGNLLAGKTPVAVDVRGRVALVTDGERATEGAIWNAAPAVVLANGAANLTWDLGEVVTVDAAYAQADNNDHYTLFGSLDGVTYRTLGRIGPVDEIGLRGRTVGLGKAEVRYLRFGEGIGDGFYSLAELAVYCQLPNPFPPALKVAAAPTAVAARNIYTYWNDQAAARVQLVLAVLGFLLLAWGRWLAHVGRAGAFAKLRTRLLAVLGLLAAGAYLNYGALHFGNFIHGHEWVHYYVGSKYFPELGYTRLYECLSTADVEAGLRRRVELRPITNLQTNVLEKNDDVIAHPERCKQHFSAERWQGFSRDVAFFRGRMGARGWDDIQLDHGYNATPLWNTLGAFLASRSPANQTQLYLLAALDPIYLAATVGVLWWAFGWRVLAVALLVFATNFPNRFYWTGGAYMRWDWLFFLSATVACLRKERWALGGAALAIATGLRVFPVFMFIPLGIAAVVQLVRTRALAKIDPGLKRFFAAAALTGTLLFGVSLVGSGGIASYQAFAANTTKHQATPLTNHVGLRTVVAWRPSEVGRILKNNETDPWQRWKEARLAAWERSKPLWALIFLGFVALTGLAAFAQRPEPWVLAALGVALIPIGVELTSYYMAFIIAVAVLYEKREEVGLVLLAMTFYTQLVAWAPIRYMSTWLDEQFTAMSAATVLAFALVIWCFRDPAAVAAIKARLQSLRAGPASRKSA